MLAPRFQCERCCGDWNVSDRISRDDATEIVGRAKFGDAWVDPATDEEFKLAKKYRSRFKTGAKVPESEALAVEWAEEREARADRQRREVNQWLENRGFDCVRGRKEGFDRGLFNAAVEREFGRIRLRAIEFQGNRRCASDDVLVTAAIEGIEKKIYANPWQAAQALAPQAEGLSVDSSTQRLSKKIRRVMRNAGLLLSKRKTNPKL
jgi:hypothetical protein